MVQVTDKTLAWLSSEQNTVTYDDLVTTQGAKTTATIVLTRRGVLISVMYFHSAHIILK